MFRICEENIKKKLCCKINVSLVWKGPSREKGADKDVSGEKRGKGSGKGLNPIKSYLQKRNGSGGTGSATTNSRQQPPPQYSSSTMAQYQQGSQYQGQQGYVGNVDRIPEQGGQYRGQYQGRVQPRSQYQQQGV